MKKKINTQKFKYSHLSKDVASIQHSLADSLTYTIGKDPHTSTARDWFSAAAHTVRNRMMENWMETMRSYQKEDPKRVYYLSLEFLIGRLFTSSMINVGLYEPFKQAADEMGLDLDELREVESDAALGNGGLGRLAACFLDSLSTLNIPAHGYGIRYEYGMFNQQIENGYQVEHPDNWLRYGNPWEFPRAEILFCVHFGGRVVEYPDEEGKIRHHWVDTTDVMAMAYDTPIPGYATSTTNNMRLWAAKASRDFELQYFNEGNYIKAVQEKNASENLSKVLYPNDTTTNGKELRLKQQFFFVSASLQDILRRFFRNPANQVENLPDKVAIQMNDTHPAVAVAEMMRLLLDTHHLDWDQAWELTTRIFSYTNHTLLPEALETWPVEMFERLLPRHLQIIYEINHHFIRHVSHMFPGDMELLKRVSLIQEEPEKRIRMAHLATVGSHRINGVARLHTELMKSTIFADFYRICPEKIVNMTNGVTPRLWMLQANNELSSLISSKIGQGWITDLSQLRQLEQFTDDSAFQQAFRHVKRSKKAFLAERVQQLLKVELNPDSLFDVQVKRIHEYKRQLLNVLHAITRYNRIRHNRLENPVPRTIIVAGKAAPGYVTAKRIIKLINDVAEVVNNDPAVRGLLKMVFIPNYSVSTALEIIPAADLSEQISTAGTEASGTGNMKLALNGALTIGTLDGANVEMREEVGEDNFFIFGLTAAEAAELRRDGYNPWDYYHGNWELREALDMLRDGFFSPDELTRHRPLFDLLTEQGDHYLLLADYAAYIAMQENVDALYREQHAWTRKSILNVARMGKFSSDRTISEYARQIWQVEQLKT